jgi:hypothetical protein
VPTVAKFSVQISYSFLRNYSPPDSTGCGSWISQRKELQFLKNFKLLELEKIFVISYIILLRSESITKMKKKKKIANPQIS